MESDIIRKFKRNELIKKIVYGCLFIIGLVLNIIYGIDTEIWTAFVAGGTLCFGLLFLIECFTYTREFNLIGLNIIVLGGLDFRKVYINGDYKFKFYSNLAQYTYKIDSEKILILLEGGRRAEIAYSNSNTSY